MISQEVIDYVRHQLDAGHSVDEITSALKQQGWLDTEITDAVNRIQSEHTQNSIKPENKQKSSLTYGLGSLFTGLFLLVFGILIMLDIQSFVLSVVNTFFSSIAYSTAEILVYILTVLLFLAGITNILSGIKLMKK